MGEQGEKRQLESESESSSSSPSSSSEKHKHRHHKHHHKTPHHHKHKHHRHHHRRHEKKKQKKVEWGKYGVLQDSDRFEKSSEFNAWIVEVKGITNPELLGKREVSELWSTFKEDFNTATMPSKKYYSLAAWEHEQLVAAAGATSKRTTETGEFEFRDEEELKREREERKKERSKKEIVKELGALATDRSKVDDMSHQEELRRMQKHLFKIGDEAAAMKIGERLKPDDPTKPK